MLAHIQESSLRKGLGVLSILAVGMCLVSGISNNGHGQELQAPSFYHFALQLVKDGKHDEAFRLAEQWVTREEVANGSLHPSTFIARCMLALVFANAGQMPQAILISQRSYEALVDMSETSDPNVAAGSAILGSIFALSGDYNRAVVCVARSLDAAKPAFSKTDSNLCVLYFIAAQILFRIGDADQAEEFYELVLAEDSRFNTTFEAADKLDALLNLSTIKQTRGDYLAARVVLQRALKVAEREFGLEHDQVARCLQQLALNYSIDDLHKGIRLLKAAVAMSERGGADAAEGLASGLSALADLSRRSGDLRNARRYAEESLAHLRASSKRHQLTSGSILTTLALVHIDLGARRAALDVIAQLQEVYRNRARILGSLPTERQRLANQRGFDPFSLVASLDEPNEIANVVLRYKGLAFEAAAELAWLVRASTETNTVAAGTRVNVLKQRLIQTGLETVHVADDLAELDTSSLEKAFRESEMSEALLASQVTGLRTFTYSGLLNCDTLKRGIPTNSTVVEYLVYSRYRGTNRWVTHYGAVIFFRSHDPEWIDLGSAEEINKDIATLQRLIRYDGEHTSRSKTLEFEASLRRISSRVWSPVEQKLPKDTRTVVVSPDGDLNFIPFVALFRPEGNFVGERFNVLYIATARDLLRTNMPATNNNIVVFTGVAFSDKPTYTWPFPALPGTTAESVVLRELATKWRCAIQEFSGTNATERELRRVDSPRLLHLATHGFVSDDYVPARGGMRIGTRGIGGTTTLPVDRRLLLNTPMHSSGIALAGAQSTWELWIDGKTPGAVNDGIVTAEEISTLNLSGTWLTTLSACDTAMGAVLTGEGVLGLKSAFLRSGTQHLLLTLWPVGDLKAASFMKDFYSALRENGRPLYSLMSVQKNWLVRVRETEGISAAVIQAGPYILNTQGKMDL